MNKLTAEKCRNMIDNLNTEWGVSGLTDQESLNLQAYQIALPILEQQERGEWIEWGGGEMPVAECTAVEVKFRYGAVSGEAEYAGAYRWFHSAQSYSGHADIIAYRIIPERGANE